MTLPGITRPGVLSGLVKTIRVRVELTPGQWELYTHLPGVQRAAGVLNRAFERTVNQGYSKEVVRRTLLGVMRRYHEQGADDPECRETLETLLRDVFG